MSSTPTAGAMRAAERIQANIASTLRLSGFITSDPARTIPGPFEMIARVNLAHYIDRDTGAAELLAALKIIRDEAPSLELSDFAAGEESVQSRHRELASAAIAKAEGGK